MANKESIVIKMVRFSRYTSYTPQRRRNSQTSDTASKKKHVVVGARRRSSCVDGDIQLEKKEHEYVNRHSDSETSLPFHLTTVEVGEPGGRHHSEIRAFNRHDARSTSWDRKPPRISHHTMQWASAPAGRKAYICITMLESQSKLKE